MGAAAAVLPMLAAVAGPALSWYNNRQYEKKLDNNLAAGIRQRGKRQDEATAKTSALIAKTAASNPDDERKQMLSGYQKQLMANQGQANGGLVDVAGGSDTYAKDLLGAALGIQQQGAKTADAFSRVDAPLEQRRGEARDAATLGSELDIIGRKSQSEDYINELKRQRIHKNPWLDALSKVAGGIASGSGGGLDSIFAGTGMFGGSSMPTLGDFGEG